MIIATGLAFLLRPTHKIADEGQKVNLELMIPKKFSHWHEMPQQSNQVVNPLQKDFIAKFYAQTISRIYINDANETIMLTIAYGEDQSDYKQVHYPEVCYPAQGFQVIATSTGEIHTDFGSIRVKRLLTTLGTRSEPLSYWTTVGNQIVIGGKETKLEQLKYSFKGQIPDGLLFRVSSITSNAEAGYNLQQRFVKDLIKALPAPDRLKLAGLNN